MSGSASSSSAKGLLSKLIKNSNQQEVPYFSPRRTRSQFKKIDSKTNLIKKNNKEAQVSSPLFPANVRKPKSENLKNISATSSSSKINLEPGNKTESSNPNQDNCVFVKTEGNQFATSSEGACSLEHDGVSKLTTKSRIHIKPEFDKEKNENVELTGKKRKLFPVNPVIRLKWEPSDWRETLENIRFMRNEIPAPVDTMGCHKCADETSDEKTIRFHKLVALMLSSQTRDETTFEAMNRLKSKNLTPQNVVTMSTDELEGLLKPVSFYRNKAKALQNTSKILIEQYNSDIPNTIDELIKLPGVGPKMAHICMKTAWNIVTGIGVDVHVDRISNRLKWVEKPTKNPEQTRIALESWLPESLWAEVNHLLVGFGQTICTPLKPKCGQCLNNRICPFAFKFETGKKKK